MNGEKQRAAPDGYTSWKEYWAAKEMPWRREPEIVEERQRYLAKRRAITPDESNGIFPFHDDDGSVTLTRADVE